MTARAYSQSHSVHDALIESSAQQKGNSEESLSPPTESFQNLTLRSPMESFPTSPLGKRILQRSKGTEQHAILLDGTAPPRFLGELQSQKLPDDFLRIPSDVAVLRHNVYSGRKEYQLVADMEQIVVEEHLEQVKLNKTQVFSRSLYRNPKVGLGMTLCDSDSYIRVHALISVDGNRWLMAPAHEEEGSPAIDAQIHPGDVVLGINGKTLRRRSSIGSNGHQEKFMSVISSIQQSPEPVVFHLYRPKSEDTGGIPMQPPPANVDREGNPKRETVVHPLADALANMRLIRYGADEISLTRKLSQLNRRARQWEASLCINDGFPTKFLCCSNSFVGDRIGPIHKPASTDISFPGSRNRPFSDAPTQPLADKVSLSGIRKGLCVRILNSFMEKNNRAFTIWVFDIESGREWYAPVRNFSDFCDLRAATQLLSPAVSEIPFPSTKWSVFGTVGKGTCERETKLCRQLEHFLRVLGTVSYREELHPGLVQVAIHVQSFLGCDIVIPQRVDVCAAHGQDADFDIAEERLARDRLLLTRLVQQHVHVVLLLDTMEHIVCQFVDEVREKTTRVADSKTPEKEGFGTSKKKSLRELNTIRAFLDQLQDLILEGCMADFKSIYQKPEFVNIHRVLDAEEGQTSWNQIIRDAVRERVEIEVYVPVRSVVSSLLVNGWRHDDTEISFKMQVLKNRPPAFFGIPGNKQNWISVSRILEDGVGRSTLPCVKLRAIVNASKELTRLYAGIKCESGVDQEDISGDNIEYSHPSFSALGADDFLPIFIYCVVQARIERPCALCVLLSTLCDRGNRIGEIGYYLSSFEAAIAHIKQIDLTENGCLG